MSAVRVLAFGAWDHGAGYPRAAALLAGLRRTGASVVECRFDLPFAGAAKQRLAARPWRWPGQLLALSSARRAAARRLAAAVCEHRPDVVLVPYPGHLVVRWVRDVWRGPLLLDLFLSAYDTAVLDRRLFRERSVCARLLRWVDRRACAAADRVLLDTPENAAFVADLVGLPAGRFAVVPVADPDECAPAPYVPPDQACPLELLFFGTPVPLHGLAILLEAVARTEGVRLTLVGGSAADRRRAAALPAGRVRLLDEFVPQDVLAALVRTSHAVAGVFGTTPKADRVVPFKVMHALAAGRPVVTASTTAIRRILADHREGRLVPAGDVAALAHALAELRADPEALPRMALAARAAYERHLSLDRVAAHLGPVLRDLGCAAAPEVRSAETAAALR